MLLVCIVRPVTVKLQEGSAVASGGGAAVAASSPSGCGSSGTSASGEAIIEQQREQDWVGVDGRRGNAMQSITFNQSIDRSSKE
jgi:hypothetical protein